MNFCWLTVVSEEEDEELVVHNRMTSQHNKSTELLTVDDAAADSSDESTNEVVLFYVAGSMCLHPLEDLLVFDVVAHDEAFELLLDVTRCERHLLRCDFLCCGRCLWLLGSGRRREEGEIVLLQERCDVSIRSQHLRPAETGSLPNFRCPLFVLQESRR